MVAVSDPDAGILTCISESAPLPVVSTKSFWLDEPPASVNALADLEDLGLTENTTYVRRVSTDREKVIRDVRSIKEEDMDYFSLLIVKGNQSEHPKAEQ